MITGVCLQEGRGAGDGSQGRRRATDQDLVGPGETERDGDLGGHGRGRRVGKICASPARLDEGAIGRCICRGGREEQRRSLARHGLRSLLRIFQHEVDRCNPHETLPAGAAEPFGIERRTLDLEHRASRRGRLRVEGHGGGALAPSGQEAHRPDRGRSHQALSITSAALQPPKPSEVERLRRGLAARGTPWTQSRSHAGSNSSRPRVAGI